MFVGVDRDEFSILVFVFVVYVVFNCFIKVFVSNMLVLLFVDLVLFMVILMLCLVFDELMEILRLYRWFLGNFLV